MFKSNFILVFLWGGGGGGGDYGSLLMYITIYLLLTYIYFTVELMADCIKKNVDVKQLGTKPCKVGNKELMKGDQCTLLPDEILEVLAGSYPYKAQFIGTKTQGK